MKITIINGSPRFNGNTEIMADAFKDAAEGKGHQVTKINLAGKKVSGCLGCQACFANEGVCVQKDDMGEILSIIDETELLVLASPIYWFDITAQLKAVVDRLYARAIKGFNIKETVLLLDSGSDGVYDAAIAMYKDMTSYVHWTDRGIITIPGMEEKGSMANAPQLKAVRELAESL